MKRLLILSIFVLAAVGQEIDHAPAVAQCQADERLWYSKLEDLSTALPNFGTLSQWNVEMADCEKVDPENRFEYYNVRGEISSEKIVRDLPPRN
jgi:hypothetical protein